MENMQKKIMDKMNCLVNAVQKQDFLQAKYLQNTLERLSVDEKKDCEQMIAFYESRGCSLDRQVEAYLLFVHDVLKETKYFAEHDKYRYSSFDEVAHQVYFDTEYMTKYMMGLGLSQYLWEQHRMCLAYFKEIMKKSNLEDKTQYMEIGPGHGSYFCEALRQKKCISYTALDIADTSLNLTRGFVEFLGLAKTSNQITYLCQDISSAALHSTYDVLVMCEVLEHVEDPLSLLKELRKYYNNKGFCFVTVPINAPVIDHIYLFHTQNEVLDMVKKAGFSVVEYKCFCANNRTLEKALRLKDAILMAMVLK